MRQVADTAGASPGSTGKADLLLVASTGPGCPCHRRHQGAAPLGPARALASCYAPSRSGAYLLAIFWLSWLLRYIGTPEESGLRHYWHPTGETAASLATIVPHGLGASTGRFFKPRAES